MIDLGVIALVMAVCAVTLHRHQEARRKWLQVWWDNGRR